MKILVSMRHCLSFVALLAALPQAACEGTSRAQREAFKHHINIDSHIYGLPIGKYKGEGASLAESAMLRIGDGWGKVRSDLELELKGAGWHRRTESTSQGVASEVYEMSDGSVIDVTLKRRKEDGISGRDFIIIANWRT